MSNKAVTIIGGGLAGCEAAWQLAQRDLSVTLYEMRPQKTTGAHHSEFLAELVCSNSLGSISPTTASGLIKSELDLFGSLLLTTAKETRVPAGNSLSVDRHLFAASITKKVTNHPNIKVIREEKTSIPEGNVLIATGPLTSSDFSTSICNLTGSENLFFFDALAPIVLADSINMEKAFRANRYSFEDNLTGDYINCPLSEQEYRDFINDLVSADTIKLHDFEHEIQDGVKAGIGKFFEGCLPIEVLAKRGAETLTYGPMRPVGLRSPQSDQRPYAVLQLRQDDLAGTLFNLVGFQTNITFPEQNRIFSKIPGLENAIFVRYGQMHRNTYISAPNLINSTLQSRFNPGLFFAGQITGIEGYIGNIASGLVAGINIFRKFRGKNLLRLPTTTMIGSLCHYISHAQGKVFQPMKANFGLLPQPKTSFRKKIRRNEYFSERAQEDLIKFIKENNLETL